jgi:hypothetical protein
VTPPAWSVVVVTPAAVVVVVGLPAFPLVPPPIPVEVSSTVLPSELATALVDGTTAVVEASCATEVEAGVLGSEVEVGGCSAWLVCTSVCVWEGTTLCSVLVAEGCASLDGATASEEEVIGSTEEAGDCEGVGSCVLLSTGTGEDDASDVDSDDDPACALVEGVVGVSVTAAGVDSGAGVGSGVVVSAAGEVCWMSKVFCTLVSFKRTHEKLNVKRIKN